MTNFEPNHLTVNISIASVHAVKTENNVQIFLKKQCMSKVGSRFVITKSEIELSLTELELLSKTFRLISYFTNIADQAKSSLPPLPPARQLPSSSES